MRFFPYAFSILVAKLYDNKTDQRGTNQFTAISILINPQQINDVSTCLNRFGCFNPKYYTIFFNTARGTTEPQHKSYDRIITQILLVMMFTIDSGGSKGVALACTPSPSNQIFLDFMQFWGKFNKKCIPAPLPEGWRPFL